MPKPNTKQLALAWVAGLILWFAVSCDAPPPQPSANEPDYKAILERNRENQTLEEKLFIVRQGLLNFQHKYGRNATNLQECVYMGTLDSIPPEPEGLRYFYDPRYGNIRFIQVAP